MAAHGDSAGLAVPQYILDHAPLVHLFSTDPYRPSSPAATLANTRPQIAFKDTPIANTPLTLANLDQLNSVGTNGGQDVFLTSIEDITTNPKWLNGVEIKEDEGTGEEKTCAIIVVDKGGGMVDAFYMYFYAFNWGGVVLGNQLGDHVGDWEHNMIRFQNGVPQAIWYSQHANGSAYTFATVLKNASGKRPLAFSATGSHALYPTPGTHDHTIPNLNLTTPLLLVDETDAGPLFDPLRSAWYYTYTPASGKFDAARTGEENVPAPTGWLYFKGRWGDDEYPATDKRQTAFFGNKKFVGGPTGPWDKQLDRKDVWPQNSNSGGQKLRNNLDAGWVLKQWFRKLNCFGCFGAKKAVRINVNGEVVG